MLDALFERAEHIPVWVLSYGNAANEIEEVVAKMSRLGRSTRGIALRYQHLPAIATEEKKATNREFLVVGWDPDAVRDLSKLQVTQERKDWQFHAYETTLD